EASLQLGAAVLEVSEVPAEATGDLLESFRREYYAQQDEKQGRSAGRHGRH
ncbi:MAG: hypothetical protein HKM88_05050, partial [Halobacteria archaeon]|nr:hypothetical protein [Halobacteria archaeon]